MNLIIETSRQLNENGYTGEQLQGRGKNFKNKISLVNSLVSYKERSKQATLQGTLREFQNIGGMADSAC